MKTVIPYIIKLQEQLSWAANVEGRYNVITKSLRIFFPLIFTSMDFEVTETQRKENFNGSVQSEKMWEEKWIKTVYKAKIPNKIKKRYYFLFAVKKAYGDIKPHLINEAWGFYASEIDSMLEAGETFQDLSRGRPKRFEIKDEKIIFPPIPVADVIGCLPDTLYRHFYLKRKKEFEFPNFPKAAR